MRRWVVYKISGLTPRRSVRFYVGCVRVRDCETWQEALQRRLEEHACGGYLCALWLRICTGLHIEKLQFANSPFDARAWELIETGKLFREKGFGVRGAAFCTITIGPREVAELHDSCHETQFTEAPEVRGLLKFLN